MKKIFFYSLLMFVGNVSFAQIRTSLVLSATPPATLSEWANRKDVLTFIITPVTGLLPDVKIKSEIKTTDGTVIGTTDLAKAAIFKLSPGTTILTAVNVVPLENMLFTGKYKSSLERTGKLPSNNYRLCVQLVTPVDYRPVSEVQCKNFYLATIQLPVLMMPANEAVLDAKIAQTAITFRWTPVVPRQTERVSYRIQVFEVLEHQNPVQALRSNPPFLDKEIRGATQYIWRPGLSFNSDTIPVRFVWILQTLDAHGMPVTQTDGSGEARSEPFVFSIRTASEKLKAGEIKISWTDNLSGDFTFKENWDYPEAVFKNEFGQLICIGLCPFEEIDRMIDENGRIFEDSLEAYYQLVDTTHEFHSIQSDAWTYEWAGTDFITVERVSKDSIVCYTHNNIATHSSLDLIIIKDIVKPSISLNSVAPTGTKTYPCNGGQIAIDRNLWNKGIMKAEFDFTFEHKENPDKPMYWKGKIYAKIESK